MKPQLSNELQRGLIAASKVGVSWGEVMENLKHARFLGTIERQGEEMSTGMSIEDYHDSLKRAVSLYEAGWSNTEGMPVGMVQHVLNDATVQVDRADWFFIRAMNIGIGLYCKMNREKGAMS